MRKLAWILALAALVTIPAVALASTRSNEVWVTNCYGSQYKPKGIVFTCGDASGFLENLKWSSWTRTKAVATGVEEVNSCQPNCAAGHYASTHATVTLTDPRHCKGRRHEDFNQMTLKFRGKSGPNSTESISLGCPLKP
jgi:hypothetical protein